MTRLAALSSIYCGDGACGKQIVQSPGQEENLELRLCRIRHIMIYIFATIVTPCSIQSISSCRCGSRYTIYASLPSAGPGAEVSYRKGSAHVKLRHMLSSKALRLSRVKSRSPTEAVDARHPDLGICRSLGSGDVLSRALCAVRGSAGPRGKYVEMACPYSAGPWVLLVLRTVVPRPEKYAGSDRLEPIAKFPGYAQIVVHK